MGATGIGFSLEKPVDSAYPWPLHLLLPPGSCPVWGPDVHLPYFVLPQERDTSSVTVTLPVPSGVAFPPVFHRSQERQVSQSSLRWTFS
jgi:hypothetical protein